MKIFVSGATGFIGSNLVKALKDHEVIGTGNQTEQSVNCKLLEPGFKGINWDKIGKVDVVFHLAANNCTTDQDREGMFLANYFGPMEMFQKLLENGTTRFIYASSASVYGNGNPPFFEEDVCEPLNPYAESKLAFEKFAKNFPSNVIGLRFSNVYGIGESHKGKRASMIHQILEKMVKKTSPILFKNGDQKRDWVFVEDIVQALISCLNYSDNTVFNCGSGIARSFNEIVTIINKELKSNLYPKYIDNPYESAYQNYTNLDMSKAEKLLNFKPKFSIEEGIKRMIDFKIETGELARPYVYPGFE